MSHDWIVLPAPLACWHESTRSARVDPMVALSVGGGFVSTSRPLAAGTPVFLELHLGPDVGAPVSGIEAMVVGHDDAPADAGFAVQFLDIDDDAERVLRSVREAAARAQPTRRAHPPAAALPDTSPAIGDDDSARASPTDVVAPATAPAQPVTAPGLADVGFAQTVRTRVPGGDDVGFGDVELPHTAQFLAIPDATFPPSSAPTAPGAPSAASPAFPSSEAPAPSLPDTAAAFLSLARQPTRNLSAPTPDLSTSTPLPPATPDAAPAFPPLPPSSSTPSSSTPSSSTASSTMPSTTSAVRAPLPVGFRPGGPPPVPDDDADIVLPPPVPLTDAEIAVPAAMRGPTPASLRLELDDEAGPHEHTRRWPTAVARAADAEATPSTAYTAPTMPPLFVPAGSIPDEGYDVVFTNPGFAVPRAALVAPASSAPAPSSAGSSAASSPPRPLPPPDEPPPHAPEALPTPEPWVVGPRRR